MKTVLIGVTMALLLTAALSWGEVYRWVDEQWVVTFRDYPPPPATKRKVTVYGDTGSQQAAATKIAAATSAPDAKRYTAQLSQPAASSGSERFSGTVELYITDWCGYCKRAVAYL